MNTIKVNGIQNFMGIDIPIVEGGFGENCKVLFTKTIAEIHEMKVKEINKIINSNIDEFEFGVDILDLKTGDYREPVLQSGILTKAEYGNSNNIYLLSEQGYMLLVGFMKTEKAKEIRKKLRREYFTMRQVINSNERLKANYLLDIYNGGQKAIIASKKLTEIEVEEAKKPLLEKNNALNNENNLLSQKNLKWADRPLINSLVRSYAKSVGGDFAKAWNDFKKELLYKHSINLNSRITNYLNTSGKKTKPKTLDMLEDFELPNAISTIVSLCRENDVDIDELLENKSE